MAAQANPDPRSPVGARTTLEILVQTFDQDPSDRRRKIRELMERDRQAFYTGAVRAVKLAANSRGVQYVVELLVSADLLVKALADPSLNREEATSLARIALNQHLRSKAAVMIGRSSRSVEWVQAKLAESDPRTRANAVEALWGVETAEARELLRAAAQDGNNRVAGNAVIALYRSGDTWVFPELVKMAASENPLFRASAAWVMGESADPRFSETLARMVGETNAIVRKRAFSALSRLKKASTQARQANQWSMSGCLMETGGDQRELAVELKPAAGAFEIKLLATQFHMLEDGQTINQFQVEQQARTQALAVTFLFPRTAEPAAAPWIQGAVTRVQGKQPADAYRVSFYLPKGEESRSRSEAAQFTSDADVAARMLQKTPVKAECADFWSACGSSIQAVNAPAGAMRSVLIYVTADPGAPADLSATVSAAVASNTTVHVISRVSSSALDELSRSTQGTFQVAASDGQAGALVEKTCSAEPSRYTIGYQPLSLEARTLTVRAYDANGWGEATIPL